jgi:hypothetical protein
MVVQTINKILSYTFHVEACDWSITFLECAYGVWGLDTTHCKLARCVQGCWCAESYYWWCSEKPRSYIAISHKAGTHQLFTRNRSTTRQLKSRSCPNSKANSTSDQPVRYKSIVINLNANPESSTASCITWQPDLYPKPGACRPSQTCIFAPKFPISSHNSHCSFHKAWRPAVLESFLSQPGRKKKTGLPPSQSGHDSGGVEGS